MFLWTIFLLVGVLQSSFKSFVGSQSSSNEAGLDDRLDCWLSDESTSETACLALGCLWDKDSSDAAPPCYFPRAGYGYKLAKSWSHYSSGFQLSLEKLPARSRFGSDAQNLKFQVKYYGSPEEGYNIVRFKLTDPSSRRYEVPIFKHLDEIEDPFGYSSKTNGYQFAYGNDEVYGFHFDVTRTDGLKTTMFNSSIGGLTFSDQFLQLATYLPSGSSLYGIGENPHPTYKHDMDYKTWPLFSRDYSPVDGSQNVYGVHPFYLCVEQDGRAHGLFFVNSNAMEFTTLPAPGVSIRTTGGILDFFLFVGDSPAEVTRLYQKIIGRPFMPPYWALGFQLSRWGYKGTSDIQEVYQRTRDAGLPYDVQYSDIDYMDQKKDFTWDKENFAGLDKFINESKADGLRWILILDPAILAVDPNYEPYNEAKARDLFIHWPKDIPASRRSNPPDVDTSKSVIYGNVWPSGPTAFPDFFKSGTRDWWKRSIASLYKDLRFDGLWIDMNEPSNFDTNVPLKKGDPWHLVCPTNMYDDPAYLPVAARTWGKGVRLSEKTICMASVQGDDGQYRHYDVHSLYGWSETEPTISGARDVTGERSMVFSRSTYPSSGVHGGHWLGDNISRWVDLHRSIIGILEFNLFGIPYIGADICGFNDNTTEEMCMRWMQLGAFYPLSRNHNSIGNIDQDPAAFGGEVLAASLRALKIRYQLLPYLYTLFHAAHTRGDKVINGLVDLYPTDATAQEVDTQFMWGTGLLISPALYEGQAEVYAYFPDDDWYDFYTFRLAKLLPHLRYEQPLTAVFSVLKSKDAILIGLDYMGIKIITRKGQGTPGTNRTITELDDTPLHVRGGTIIPSQESGKNTLESRKTPFTILVYPNSNTLAEGELYWDDGVSIDTFEKKNYLHYTFSYEKNVICVISTILDGNLEDGLYLKEIKVFNTTTKSTKALINGEAAVPVKTDFSKKIMTIETDFEIHKQTIITITWD